MNKLLFYLCLSMILSCSSIKENTLVSTTKEESKYKYSQTGTIENVDSLYSILKENTRENIETNKPLVIIYHLGENHCNTYKDSYDRRNKRRLWIKQLHSKLNKIAEVKPVYIYKDTIGINKFKGIVNYYKDPDSTIEYSFFKEQNYCSNFVVVSPNGNFISNYGEYPKEAVWEAAKLILNKD